MNTTEIELHSGQVMLVDTADVAMLSGFTLQPHGGYVRADRGRFTILVHRLIIGAGRDFEVDHINGNGLDNRSANLRSTNSRGNKANSRGHRGSTSRHKGVCWDKSRSKWAAYVHTDGKTTSLGRFDNEDAAALAYNAAAVKIWGEMARLNIVEGGGAQ